LYKPTVDPFQAASHIPDKEVATFIKEKHTYAELPDAVEARRCSMIEAEATDTTNVNESWALSEIRMERKEVEKVHQGVLYFDVTEKENMVLKRETEKEEAWQQKDLAVETADTKTYITGPTLPDAYEENQVDMITDRKKIEIRDVAALNKEEVAHECRLIKPTTHMQEQVGVEEREDDLSFERGITPKEEFHGSYTKKLKRVEKSTAEEGTGGVAGHLKEQGPELDIHESLLDAEIIDIHKKAKESKSREYLDKYEILSLQDECDERKLDPAGLQAEIEASIAQSVVERTTDESEIMSKSAELEVEYTDYTAEEKPYATEPYLITAEIVEAFVPEENDTLNLETAAEECAVEVVSLGTVLLSTDTVSKVFEPESDTCISETPLIEALPKELDTVENVWPTVKLLEIKEISEGEADECEACGGVSETSALDGHEEVIDVVYDGADTVLTQEGQFLRKEINENVSKYTSLESGLDSVLPCPVLHSQIEGLVTKDIVVEDPEYAQAKDVVVREDIVQQESRRVDSLVSLDDSVGKQEDKISDKDFDASIIEDEEGGFGREDSVLKKIEVLELVDDCIEGRKQDLPEEEFIENVDDRFTNGAHVVPKETVLQKTMKRDRELEATGVMVTTALLSQVASHGLLEKHEVGLLVSEGEVSMSDVVKSALKETGIVVERQFKPCGDLPLQEELSEPEIRSMFVAPPTEVLFDKDFAAGVAELYETTQVEAVEGLETEFPCLKDEEGFVSIPEFPVYEHSVVKEQEPSRNAPEDLSVKDRSIDVGEGAYVTSKVILEDGNIKEEKLIMPGDGVVKEEAIVKRKVIKNDAEWIESSGGHPLLRDECSIQSDDSERQSIECKILATGIVSEDEITHEVESQKEETLTRSRPVTEKINELGDGGQRGVLEPVAVAKQKCVNEGIFETKLKEREYNIGADAEKGTITLLPENDCGLQEKLHIEEFPKLYIIDSHINKNGKTTGCMSVTQKSVQSGSKDAVIEEQVSASIGVVKVDICEEMGGVVGGSIKHERDVQEIEIEMEQERVFVPRTEDIVPLDHDGIFQEKDPNKVCVGKESVDDTSTKPYDHVSESELCKGEKDVLDQERVLKTGIPYFPSNECGMETDAVAMVGVRKLRVEEEALLDKDKANGISTQVTSVLEETLLQNDMKGELDSDDCFVGHREQHQPDIFVKGVEFQEHSLGQIDVAEMSVFGGSGERETEVETSGGIHAEGKQIREVEEDIEKSHVKRQVEGLEEDVLNDETRERLIGICSEEEEEEEAGTFIKEFEPEINAAGRKSGDREAASIKSPSEVEAEKCDLGEDVCEAGVIGFITQETEVEISRTEGMATKLLLVGQEYCDLEALAGIKDVSAVLSQDMMTEKSKVETEVVETTECADAEAYIGLSASRESKSDSSLVTTGHHVHLPRDSQSVSDHLSSSYLVREEPHYFVPCRNKDEEEILSKPEMQETIVGLESQFVEETSREDFDDVKIGYSFEETASSKSESRIFDDTQTNPLPSEAVMPFLSSSNIPQFSKICDTSDGKGRVTRKPRQQRLVIDTNIAETEVKELICEVREVTRQIKQEVREMKPDLTPTPEGKESSILPVSESREFVELTDLGCIKEEQIALDLGDEIIKHQIGRAHV
jgi:hypothetical protein